jgi:adenylate cyclase
MSERLGAERTRLLLNPYLRMMSSLLVEHRAIVNKFMGDGVFAFFNAPIWPCANHAEQACASALASLEALRELNRRPLNPTASARGEVEELVMRIGLSTGDAFVGDYGSDTKLDYTCIGDTVNLASRLEKANKALGTRILVDETTRDRAGQGFAFRTLGRMEVSGRSGAVNVYELAGAADRIDAAARDFLSRFEEAVRHYQACEWAQCLDGLGQCRGLRPDDLSVQLYESAARRLGESPPPPPDWNGAIEVPTT